MLHPGERPGPRERPGNRGKRLLTQIKELLRMKSLNPKAGKGDTRLTEAADAFVRAMELGSFPHLKEFIEREEGKVAQKISNADGSNIKLYAGMPVSDSDGAP